MQPADSSRNILGGNNKRVQHLLLFAFFFGVTFLVYLPAVHGKFVADFIDMVFDISERPPLTDFSRGILFDFVNRLVFQVWLHWFGFNVWAWHFLQSFLHGLNALLLYTLVSVMLGHFQYRQAGGLSLLVALGFLLSPYHTEPVVWSGDINYLLAGNFILLHLLAFVFFLQQRKAIYALIAVFAFTAGIFTHELAWFLLPADLVLALTLTASLRAVFSKSNIVFGLVLAGVMVLYLVNKMLSGNLVGHYGSAVHLNFQPVSMLALFYKYIIKILLLGNFMPLDFLNKLYGWIDKAVVVSVLVAGTIIFGFLSFRAARKSPRIKAVICFFLLFVVFIFPVLNLYFPYWIKIHGDRYSYVTSAFLIASCFVALYTYRPVVSVAFAVVYLAVSYYGLAYNIASWRQAGKLAAKLESGYRWHDAVHVYILNLPENYRGAYMYRGLSNPNSFAEGFIKYGKALDGEKIAPVLAYNLNEPTDSVIVDIVSPDKLQVSLSAWGNWWWRQAAGAGDYEDDRVKVDVDDYCHAYTVQFKQKQPGDVFLYCANGEWREVHGF